MKSKKIYKKFSFVVSGNFVEKEEIIDKDIKKKKKNEK